MKDSSGSEFALPQGPMAERIPRRRTPGQDRSKATVEAVLQATLQVLLTEGYEGLNTTRIARRAGVSVGSLYQYFPDKAALILALKVQYIERLTGAVAQASQAARGQPLEPAVRTMLAALLAVKRENLALALALRPALGETHSDGLVRAAALQMVGDVAAVLQAAVPELREPERVARLLVAALEGALSAVISESPEALHSAALLDELVALAVGYVRARDAVLPEGPAQG